MLHAQSQTKPMSNREVGHIIPHLNNLVTRSVELIKYYRKRINQGSVFRSSEYKISLYDLKHDSTKKIYCAFGLEQLCAIFLEGACLSELEYEMYTTTNSDWEILGENENKTGFPRSWQTPFNPERECLQNDYSYWLDLVKRPTLENRLKLQGMSEEEKGKMYKEPRRTFTIEDLCKDV